MWRKKAATSAPRADRACACGRARVAIASLVGVLHRRDVRVRVDLEVLLADLERRRSRRHAAVAAVLDQRAHDELRLSVRTVSAPPRLVLQTLIAGQADELLSRSGLSGDLDRERAEDPGRRPVGRVRRFVEAFLHDAEGTRVESD